MSKTDWISSRVAEIMEKEVFFYKKQREDTCQQ